MRFEMLDEILTLAEVFTACLALKFQKMGIKVPLFDEVLAADLTR